MFKKTMNRLKSYALSPTEEQFVEQHPEEFMTVVKTYIRCRIETEMPPDMVCRVEKPSVGNERPETKSGRTEDGVREDREIGRVS